MALAIVVWFIAGMSLLVAGIVSHASMDTRMAQLHVAKAKAKAAGDGAIQLFLADLISGGIAAGTLGNTQSVEYRVGEIKVMVGLVPGSGLIDINSAPAALMSSLFSVVGGLDEVDAQSLGGSVVDWRQRSSQEMGRRSGGGSFATNEDLLRVEGVTRALYDKIKDYVVAGKAASGNTNWLYSPPDVMAVLEKYDASKFAAVVSKKSRLADRQNGSPEAAGAFRADAVLQYGGRTWLRRRWVIMVDSGVSLLNWQIIRTEAPRVVAGEVVNNE